MSDFAAGVPAANHPEGAGTFGVWYDATNAAFSNALASTLDGSPAMRFDDGGFANGIYIIYSGVVPATGTYAIEADVKVNETAAAGFTQLQIGASAGAAAAHRGLNPSSLAATAVVGNYSGLTAGNDSANPTQKVVTTSFTANAGDNVLVAISTDVVSGAWNAGSSSWGGNFVLVDNIVLKDLNAPPPPPPTTDPIVIDDFSGGVSQANNPSPGNYRVWYDSTPSTFGTPSASTLDGSPAMRIDDGGFANGVYAIYQNAIPAAGHYRVEFDMDVVETAAGINGIRAYQIGVATGASAVHRAAAGNLPALSITGTYLGLTPNDDNANPTQRVVTGIFQAAGPGDLLLALGTDVESGTSANNSSTWSSSFVLVDNLTLQPVIVEPPPVEIVLDNDQGAPVYASSGFSTSGSTGYNGGTYQFATIGTNATASWTGSIPEAGFYDVAVQFRSGANRASVASYTITTADGLAHATADQRSNNLSWVSIGEFHFEVGPFTVTLSAADSTGSAGAVVIADAVRVRELPGPPPIDPPEIRLAHLLVYDGLNDVGTIQNWVNDIHRKRYNGIAVHTRYRGDATYFPNKYDATFPNTEPRSDLVGDVDVLEEVVTRGHELGLKVFAYVNTMLVTEGTDTDPRPEHVLNQHPEWVTWEYNGGNPQPHTTATEVDGIWLDPALPGVQLYNATICADIVMNYDVDGVVLDRQRYPDTRFNRLEADYGYHPDAVAMFNAEYGKTGLPDPFDTDWWQFRRDANTKGVQLIYSTIMSIDPDLLLMSFPIGRFNDAINFNYQDWPTWLERGVMDVALPQIYTSSNAEFSARAAEHRNAYNGERFLAIVHDVFRPGTDLVTQISIGRTLGFAGSSLFSHADAGPLGYFDVLGDAYVGIAPWPDAPWKDGGVYCDGYDIAGTDGNDLLVGTACGEYIASGLGTDVVIASGGDDVIEDAGGSDQDISGGDGNDAITLAAGDRNRVDGGEGDDSISLGAGNYHVVLGGGGSDQIAILDYSNGATVDAGEGDNAVALAAGNNQTVTAGAGNDTVSIVSGNNQTVDAGDGDNEVTLGIGNDLTISGGSGDDTVTLVNGDRKKVHVGDGDNTVTMGKGNDPVVTAGSGNDTVTLSNGDRKNVSVGDGNNVVTLGQGNDAKVITGDGNDAISIANGDRSRAESGDGDDTFNIGRGNDRVVVAGAGNDTIVSDRGDRQNIDAGDGDDTVTVSNGNDKTIRGGAGNDTIAGGQGDRTKVTGGEGDDILSVTGGNDTQAIYSGPRANYAICKNADGSLTIVDTVGTDGIDNAKGFKKLVFSDTTINASSIVAVCN